MLGPDQPVILHLLDIPPAAQSLEGVKMELIDAALPLLAGQLHARHHSGTMHAQTPAHASSGQPISCRVCHAQQSTHGLEA